MHRLKIVLLTLATLAVLAAPVSAAGFGLHGSYWDADVDELLGGGILVAIPLGAAGLDLDFRASFFEEGNVDNIFDSDADVFHDASIEVIPVEVGVKFNFAPFGPFNPYVGGGGSYFFIDHDLRGVEIDDEVGFYGLVGSRFGNPGGVGFYVEAIYRDAKATIEDDDTSDFDLVDDVDVDLGGLGVNAGVMFSFGR